MGRKSKENRGLILKTWERCRSIGRGSKGLSGVQFGNLSPTPRSWPSSPVSPVDKQKRRVTPEGSFSVYVGPEKQRFVIKTNCINHPLFRMLLEEAEMEYGYACAGPLVLPCSVDVFYKVLSEMDGDDIYPGCNFVKRYGSYNLLSPSRLVSVDHSLLMN